MENEARGKGGRKEYEVTNRGGRGERGGRGRENRKGEGKKRGTFNRRTRMALPRNFRKRCVGKACRPGSSAFRI